MDQVHRAHRSPTRGHPGASAWQAFQDLLARRHQQFLTSLAGSIAETRRFHRLRHRSAQGPLPQPPPWLSPERQAENIIAAAYAHGPAFLLSMCLHVQHNLTAERSRFMKRTGTNGWLYHDRPADDVPTLPRNLGPVRRMATALFLDQLSYLDVLWVVATAYLAGHPPLRALRDDAAKPMTKREADILRKDIDRAWSNVSVSLPPAPPRGWWHTQTVDTPLGPVVSLLWPRPDRAAIQSSPTPW